MQEVQVSKTDLRLVRTVDVPAPPLAEQSIRLGLDLFALTSNNVTYAAMGEGALGYWDFFPGPEGWGRPPVWGFATVIASNTPGIEQGARYWGFYPAGEVLDVTPADIRPNRFTDGAPHRAGKYAIYNLYLNTADDPAYDPEFEAEQTLFRPLYATGWWIADCTNREHPTTVVMSSASSKTALATAHQLLRLGDAELLGLTSRRNESYVRDTGLYHQTVIYDHAESLKAEGPVIYLDFLGRDSITGTVHRALTDQVQRSWLIGATDWGDKPGGIQPPLTRPPGPAPEFFLAPSYAAERSKSDPTIHETMMEDLRAFYPASRAFVTPRLLRGSDSIVESWARLTAGDATPAEGLVLSFQAE